MSEKLKAHSERVNSLLLKYYDESHPLFHPLRDSLFYSRKRMRATLAYTGACVVGGTEEDADAVAMLYEMATAGYVLVDDSSIFDAGKMRAGRPAPRHAHGEAAAMLSSLVLQLEPLRMLVNNDRLVRIFYDSAMQTINGEFHDQVLSEAPVDSFVGMGRVVDIARMKTGSLLSGAAMSGAILAGGSDEEVMALDKYCMDMGTAYQVADHIIDVFSDGEKTGKDSFSDFKTRKKSVLINHALSALPRDSHERLFLVNCIGREPTQDEKEVLKSTLTNSGSLRHACDIVLDYNAKARSHLNHLKQNEHREILWGIPNFYTKELGDLGLVPAE